MTEARLPEAGDPDRRLDVSGELCPVPMLRARDELSGMAPGDVLEVIATDPLAELDLAVMCERTEHSLLGSRTEGQTVRLWIRAGQDRRSG